MKFKELIKKADCKIFYEEDDFLNLEIKNVVAGDLMSEVLVEDREEILLITNLNTEQVLHTANIVDAVAVLFVNGKVPQKSMIKLAEEFNISLISTNLGMYSACKSIE